MLWRYLERFGRPLVFYTDKAGMFRVTREPIQKPLTEIEGLSPITPGAIRRIGTGHPLMRDPARVTQLNTCIRMRPSKPDVSTSLR